MPRVEKPVKKKAPQSQKRAARGARSITALGAVDIHFHGAFGTDVMTADSKSLDMLSARLWKQGVAAFCPTTVSTTFDDLKSAVSRIGAWIRQGTAPGAKPLGIHLEGPYIHPHACGAHPPEAIRKFSLRELGELWEASLHTLKILTIAPESLSPAERRDLAAWAKENDIVLSLGHSKATEAQAQEAFESGFTQVTHAWNALPFHHRSPGPLGAAFGRKGVAVELILDGVHVSPTLVRWTREIHPADQLCFVSDCVPAAETAKGSWHAFGPLKITYQDGACRLKNGGLAGGGHVLTKLYAQWAENEAKVTGKPLAKIVKESLPSLQAAQLKALNIPMKWLSDRKVRYEVRGASLSIAPAVSN